MTKLIAIAMAIIAFPALAATVAEERLQAQCDAMHERQGIRRDRERLAQDSEAKDPNWAYAMELKVRDYTSRSFRQDQIQVTKIDCRTSFCDLEVEGFGREARERFSEVIIALPQESWNDFVNSSLSVREESGKVILGTRVVRKTADAETSEQRADEQLEADCAAMLGRQAQRVQAARDAEPRDASWAGPMEQLLREYLTTQLAQHPFERLEVRCKTTFCWIRAEGGTKASHTAFQEIAQVIGQEPWSDLRAGAEGKGYSDGKAWSQEYTLLRDL